MRNLTSRHGIMLQQMLIVSIICLSAVNTAWAEVRSIQDFMKFEEKWPDFALTGYAWQLEGRYAVISEGTLTFTNCSLPFRITEDQGNRRGNTGVVEVTGKLVNGEKGLAFHVEKLTARPRDLDQVKALRFAIDTQKPAEWYKVADWARTRGQFYNDKELIDAARDLDRNGVLTELRQLNPADESGFETLIKKAREKKLEAALIQQMIHDSLWARLINIRNHKYSDPALRDLLVRIRQELPGANDSLKALPEEQQQNYLADPKAIFASANAENRKVLSRLFALEVISERILHDAQADGSNGFRIADHLRTEAPERVDLAKKFEALAVADRMKKIEVSTRAQLLELTERLGKMNQQEQAIEAKKKWLKSRESLFKQDGARGLADLAQQWMTLLGDEAAAAQFYIDAWRENPQYTPATEWLTAHGYQQVNSTWLPESEIPNMPLSPLEQAIREGRVEVGMNAAQVQAALGAEPSSITRLASRRQVTEWWTYRESGVVVKLVTSKREKTSEVVTVQRLQSP